MPGGRSQGPKPGQTWSCTACHRQVKGHHWTCRCGMHYDNNYRQVAGQWTYPKARPPSRPRVTADHDINDQEIQKFISRIVPASRADTHDVSWYQMPPQQPKERREFRITLRKKMESLAKI
eukprot:3148661-Pyramimonas_sp.AAC.1